MMGLGIFAGEARLEREAEELRREVFLLKEASRRKDAAISILDARETRLYDIIDSLRTEIAMKDRHIKKLSSAIESLLSVAYGGSRKQGGYITEDGRENF